MTHRTRPCARCGTFHSRHNRAIYCGECFLKCRRERNQMAKLNHIVNDRCTDCGKPKGERGTTIRCRPCANVRSAWERNRQRQMAEAERTIQGVIGSRMLA